MKNRSSQNKTLEEYVEELYAKTRRGRFNILKNIYNDIASGKIVLMDPAPPRDFVEYLSRPDYALWLWTTITLTAATIITVALSPIALWIIYLRYILGSISVLFLPGYVLIEALYPKEQDLSSLERLALSIGLSLAVVPLIGLLLNYTPWGIRLESVLISLTIFIAIMAIVASYRKYQILKKRV